jgi:hypothetical protein
MNFRTRSVTLVAVLALLPEITFAQSYANQARLNDSKDVQQAPSLELIVKRLGESQLARKNPSSYELVRAYRISGGGRNSIQADVTASLDFSPEKNTYTIEKHEGSVRGTEVVRRIVEHEVGPSGSQPASSVALTPSNYDFRYAGEAILDGQPCYLLGLTPKRKQKELIAGQAWIDQNTFEVRQIEGDLAKSPSFWLKKVHVLLTFGDVAGTWLQTRLNAQAEVRFLGTQTLTSDLVDFKTPEMVAQKSPPTVRVPGANAFRQH